MIQSTEIRKIARKTGLPAGLIEKDYANTLILKEVYKHNLTKDMLVFKGGTAIYKLYFPTKWRFSEDLDFTTSSFGISGNKIVELFNEIIDGLNAENPDTFEISSSHTNPGYTQIKIQYNGPLGSRNTTKIDISLKENIHFPIVKMVHEPSYIDIEKFTVNAYSIEEIMVEKVRSLFQRTRVRDLFDVHKLIHTNNFDKKQIRQALKLKSIEKNVELNTETVLNQNTRDELVGYWEKSLGLFTKDLPDYDDVHTDVQEYVCKLIDGE